MKTDPANFEFNLASDLVEYSDRNLFLTGRAGTGKTTFLKYIAKKNNKKTAIVAPTGIAAINAGGMTIHSLFQIKPSVYPPNDIRLRISAPAGDQNRSTIRNHFKYREEKRKLLQELELLIIDEVSMVRCDLLDVVDRLLRIFGGGSLHQPFGGKQVLFIGDAFQLPPVAPGPEWEILRNFYPSPFFFSSQAFRDANPVYLELKKIYRQQDQHFIDILNRIRDGRPENADLHLLNSKIPKAGFNFDREEFIYLGTHNKIVNDVNREKLRKLPGDLHTFQAEITGNFPEKEMPAPKSLKLKPDAQVMFVRNDTGEARRYVNGSIGKIIKLDGDEVEVKLNNGRKVEVKKTTWEKINYKWNEDEGEIDEETVGSFTQYPLKLAWAITVHKSQGLTFEKVYADLPDAWDAGQVYVALSRCTSLEGLKLARKVFRRNIITSPDVKKFASYFQSESHRKRLVEIAKEEEMKWSKEI